ncbi:MAG TPA: WD40 repeat domain-containing protein, partial [Acidimicrobiales bacterium]|nr:WD40 repeat domain-containing protein [Acidimicrobiales bacterium]
AFGLRVDPALVEVLVGEVAGEPGALPLLSHALRSTWERRDTRTLALDAYRATGGLRAAIATTAENVYGQLDADDQDLARRTFLALTEPGEGTEDSRRWATLIELTPAGGANRVEGLLDAMAAERLVSRDEGRVAVAHEALIREWPRLRGWLDEDREGLRLHRDLARSAAAWGELGREPAELYRGPRLAAALEWAARTDDLSTLEAAFLAASRAEQERGERARARTTRRLRGLLAGVGVALVVAVVAALVAYGQRREAADARDRADVARVAAVSRSLMDSQPDVGLLLAATAYDLEDTADTRSTLLSALEAHPLLEGLIYGNDSGLESATFSPDGQVLATATSDGTGTLLWDTETHDQLAALAHEGDLSLDTAISPDGRTLAVPAIHYREDGRPEGRLEIWDLESQALVEVVPSPAGSLSTAAYTADGSRLVTQGGPGADAAPRDVVVVWDTQTWEPVGEPWVLDPGYSGDEVLEVSPDGSLVAMPSPDGGAVGIWRSADRTFVAPVDVHGLVGGEELPVTELAFAPDGQTLAIATDGGSILFVDAATGAEAAEPLRLAESAGTAVEYSPDGTTLAVGRIDGQTQLYDLASREPLGPPLAANASQIKDVSFSADGTLLATTSTDRTGALWRLDGGRSFGIVLSGQDGATTEAVYAPDGSTLLTSSVDGTVAVRDAATGEIERSITLGGEVESVAVSPDGARAAAGGSGGTVVLFDIDGGDRVEVPVDGVAHQVAFAPDGRTVAVALDHSGAGEVISGAGIGELRFLDAATGDEARAPIDVGEPAVGTGFSPDGGAVVAVTDNNVLRLYDPGSGAEFDPAIENVDAMITSFAFSPDGDRLLVGVTSGAVRPYDATTHEPAGEAFESDLELVFGLAYAPDGSVVAGTNLGFSTASLWDAATGSPIGDVLIGGRVPYTYQTFTLDHLLWARPAFSPDGRHLVTPGFDGATVVWDLDPDAWLAAACDLAGRDLSVDEWARYLPDREPERLCEAG